MLSPSVFAMLPVLATSLMSLFIINKFIKIPPRSDGNLQLDGLRGYLAFAVFLHHSALYFTRIFNQKWDISNSNIYAQFGQTSVFIFFMITSFLFISKLIESQNKKIDWKRYYIARFLRIYPLYFLVLIIIIIIVGHLTRWKIATPIYERGIELISWIFFMQYPLNNYRYTVVITSDIMWSLSREWQFYSLVPLIAFLFMKIKPTLTIIYFSLSLLFLFIVINDSNDIIGTLKTDSPFLVGIIAAFTARNGKINKLASTNFASLTLISMILVSFIRFNTIFSFIPYLFISLSFILIACGNSLYGLLTNYISLILGQVSFGIYLIHPIILFIVFQMCPNLKVLGSSNEVLFWSIISIIGMMIMVIASLTYRFLEKPFIDIAPLISKLSTHLNEKN